MTPVIVIRPQPGCDATVAAARALGLEARGFALFDVRALPWQAPDADSFDALLIGSANALRHGGAGLAACGGKPVYAVGQATADAARAAGFEVVATGKGGLQALLAELRPDHRRLLRLSGEARVDLAPPPEVSIVERLVYASEGQPMPPALAALLQEPAVVLLHSGEAARHFAWQCDRVGIDRRRISLAAIGPRVAAAAGDGWRTVAWAALPADAALLALAGEMCQIAASSQEQQDRA